MARPQAALVRSAIMRTNAGVPRPAPSLFTLPGLTARPWWDAALRAAPPAAGFGWMAALEAATPTIRAEFEAMASSRPSDYKLDEGEKKLHSGSWNWLSAVTKGRFDPAFAAACPVTTELLAGIPGLMTGGVPFAYAFFSSLRRGAAIAPHYGPSNLRIRFHLPLIVPPDAAGPMAARPTCGIRVGNEVRRWEEGRLICFDDSFEHETWNDPNPAAAAANSSSSTAGASVAVQPGDRVVLLFDVWHPEIAPAEREAIQEMFEEARAKGWLSEGAGAAGVGGLPPPPPQKPRMASSPSFRPVA